MQNLFKIILSSLAVEFVACGIASFMDPRPKRPKEDNPCNPLYWYPRHIPDYCYNKGMPDVIKPLPPPAPAPLPVPIPIPVPIRPPIPAPLPVMPMRPIPVFPAPAVTYGIPSIPTNPMVALGGIPYPVPPMFMPGNPMIPGVLPENLMYPGPPSPGNPMFSGMYPQGPMLGFVPGIPGLVTSDGGINVLPFSDVYSDFIERHKQQMTRKKLNEFLTEQDRFWHRKEK